MTEAAVQDVNRRERGTRGLSFNVDTDKHTLIEAKYTLIQNKNIFIEDKFTFIENKFIFIEDIFIFIEDKYTNIHRGENTLIDDIGTKV